VSDEDTTIDIKGLEKLIKALKGPAPEIRVGILGSGAARSGGGATNAYIGYCHEYGRGVPQRSFLREPLSDLLGDRLEESGAFDESVMKEMVASGSLLDYSKKIGVLAEGIVLEAFDTGGFGKWAALKPRTLSRKKVHQILVETQQLRNSITSDVKI
jgi:hypothetical protein